MSKRLSEKLSVFFLLSLSLMLSASELPESWQWKLDTANAKLANVTLDNTLTNWVLNVSELDADKKTLTLGVGDVKEQGDAYTYITGSDGTKIGIIGSGKMDLSLPITDENGESWAATAIAQGRPFAITNGLDKVLTEFVFPTTIKEIRGLAFCPIKWGYSGLQRVTMVCPELEAIPTRLFYSNSSMTYLRVVCPKVKTIGDLAFRELYVLSDTNLDDWDLSGVETIVGKNPNGAFSYLTITNGTLRLPNVVQVDESTFFTSQMRVELGLNRTLKYVGPTAFGARDKNNGSDITLTSVVLGGALDGWELAPGAMRLDSGSLLREITFLGPLPKALEPGQTYFSHSDDAELKVCFYLNGEFAECKAILDAATPATEAEIFAFTNANKLAEPPCGIVEPSVFGTANRQFVGRSNLGKYMTPEVSYAAVDERYGDSVELDGEVAFGSTVTLKPVINTGNSFVEWVGAPADALLNPVTHELTFTIGYAPISVSLRTRHSWRLLPANTEENPSTTNRITDGVWALNVIIDDAKNHALLLGSRQYIGGSAYTGVGSGVLDLNGPIYDPDGSTLWTITRLGNYCLGSPAETTSVITEVYLPSTVTNNNFENLIFKDPSVTSTLKRLVVDLPYVTALDSGLERNQTLLEELVLNIPNVKSIGGFTFCDHPNLKADAGDWKLDKLEVLCSGRSFSTLPGLTGTLRLPSITLITNSVYTLSALEALEMGLALTNRATRFKKKLQLYTGNTLSYCPKLKTLVFGPYRDIDFSSSGEMFKKTSGLKEIVFTGRPITKSALDVILRGVPEPTDGDIQTAIYASSTLGWGSADYVLPIGESDAEKPYADIFAAGLGEKEALLGIYNSASGTRKAWIVHRPSPCDPVGTILLVR